MLPNCYCTILFFKHLAKYFVNTQGVSNIKLQHNFINHSEVYTSVKKPQLIVEIIHIDHMNKNNKQHLN